MTEPYDDRSDRPDELRSRLHDAVADVEPRPALDALQARTKVTPMSSKRPWILAAAGAVVAVTATVGVVVAVTGDDPGRTPVAAEPTDGTSDAQEPGPADEPTDEPSDDPAEGPTDETVAVPVYYVADQPGGPALFREFHQMPVEEVDASQVAEALRTAVAGTALDPDYRSSWPADTSVSGVTVDGVSARDIVWVDLSAPEDLRLRPPGMADDEATMAVQQLVYTAQAVLQTRHPIGFLVDGEPVGELLGVPVAEQAVAGDPLEVQGSVWIIDPQDGSEVGTTFTVEGRGAFFEATVSWQLLQDGEVVDEGFTTAEEAMTLSPYSFEVTAEPGDYVLRVYESDVSGGEGLGEPEDTKRITVVE